jgi:hypothetical protein
MTETNPSPVGAAAARDNRSSNLTTEELKIIQYFAQGQKHSLSSQNLKLEYTETSIRLSDARGTLLGISKQVNQWQRKVLLTNNSSYRPSIIQAFVELEFITKQKSSHPEFTEHHHYQIPNGYKLNYTEAIELWKVWWNNKRYQLNTPNPPIDVLTFTKGNWYLIQDLQPKQGNFIIRTERGELKIDSEEYVVWIDAVSAIKTNSKLFNPSQSSAIKQRQTLAATPSVPLDANLISGGNTGGEISSSSRRSSVAAEQPSSHSATTGENPEHHNLLEPEYIDLESYLNTFNTEDTEDIDRIEGIYNIGELLSKNDRVGDDVPTPPTPKIDSPSQPTVVSDAVASTPDPATPAPAVAEPTQPRSLLSIAQRQASLKHKALTVLANYLQEGDLITHTEVLKNAQGQEMNRKIVKIQRGCPSWAIDQIRQLDR